MRYQVLNLPSQYLGQDCTGGVCSLPVKPSPGYVAPARTVGRRDALKLANLIASTIENNPSCFEGEDLSVAHALESKLREYGQPVALETFQTAVLMELSEEEARVAGRAETCSAPKPVITPTGTHVRTPTGTPVATQPGMLLPPGPTSFPVVPIAVGAGALGLLALLIAVVK